MRIQKKYLKVRKFGYKRVVNNERRFGWEPTQIIKHTETTSTTEYEGKVYDDGDVIITPHTTTTSKTRMKLYFERDKDRIANYSTVSLIEVLYDLVFLLRRAVGLLIPISCIGLGFVFLMGDSDTEIGKQIITICGTVLVAWFSGVALESIIAFIGSKVIKFDY